MRKSEDRPRLAPFLIFEHRDPAVLCGGFHLWTAQPSANLRKKSPASF